MSAPNPIILPRTSITVDPSIQQRVEMDDALVAEYQQDIGDWIQYAPVVVFASDGLCWLADGFHRVSAADKAGLTEVPAIVHQGGKAAALRYAISANATHGKRRTAGDLAKAYRRAVAEQMVEPGDTEAVAALLNCSRRRASDLTREVREQVNAEVAATIQQLAEEGKTQREIAEQVGMSQRGVGKVLENFRKASESSQDEPDQEMQSAGPDDQETERETDTARSSPAPALNPNDRRLASRTPAPAKGPTAKDAMHAAHAVTGALNDLRKVEDVLVAPDALTLIGNLRQALERLSERFEQKGGSGHA